jgi:hypothetical protein
MSKHVLQFGAEGPVGMNNAVHDKVRILNLGDVDASIVFSYYVSDSYVIKFSPQAGLIKTVTDPFCMNSESASCLGKIYGR